MIHTYAIKEMHRELTNYFAYLFGYNLVHVHNHHESRIKELYTFYTTYHIIYNIRTSEGGLHNINHSGTVFIVHKY